MDTFHFKGFIPSEDLRLKAERVLDHILEQAPADAQVIASLERAGERYHCHLEIGSASCPLALETSHSFPSIALDKAELTALRKLGRWRGGHFTPGSRDLRRSPLRSGA